MKRLQVLLLLLFFGTSGYTQLSDEQTNNIYQIANETIDGISPGMAIGIVHEGEIIFEHYAGYSNLEHTIKIDKATRFNIASNAKQFTALCILKLVEENKISLSDDIRNYLPQLFPEYPHKITISNLINHSSGIRDVYDLWALQGRTWWKLFVGNDEAMELLKAQKDLNFIPGTAYLYSNSNYIILTEIIAQITGKPFDEFAIDLFKSLQMVSSGFLTDYMQVIPGKARPYGYWGSWKEYPFITETHGDGALFTTLTDQLKWESIIQTNNSSSLPQALIIQSQKPIPDSNISTYGFGLMIDAYKGKKCLYHDGSTGAYNATFLRFPDDNTSIIVLSNNSSVSSNYVAKRIADVVLEINDTNELFPSGPEETQKWKSFKELTGTYKTENGTIINIIMRNDSLFREIYQQNPVLLVHEKEGLFHYQTNEDLKINFIKDEEVNKQFTIYLSSQKPNTAKIISTEPISLAYKKSISGKYYNDETDTTIEIDFSDSNMYSITKNGKTRSAELIYKDYLRMNSYELSIARNKNGMIDGLMVNNGRIKNVLFKKI